MSKVFASAINKLRLISLSPPPPPPLSSSSSALQIQQRQQRQQRQRPSSSCYRFFGTSSTTNGDGSKSEEQPNSNNKVYWNEEWQRLGLGATFVDDSDGSSTTQAGTERSKQNRRLPDNLFFVQLGFGVDQHGDTTNDATKACVRAVRNAIEFNSIPGVIQHVPGGRHGMLIHVKLGVPPPRLSADGVQKEDETIEKESQQKSLLPSYVDVAQVAKVFPYGRLLPIEVVVGGVNFHSGRVVEELGDKDDVGICCVACVTIGYDNDDNDDHNDKHNDNNDKTTHQTFNTKDGY
mmetsp:Transcript_60050/g.147612  ORF Transcript_60050/g.147612 Transcript_60050/m.147612 type:complete len:292 (+) Transcript_60050:60-935(+)